MKKLLDGIECKIVQYKTPFVIIDDIFHLCSMNDCPRTDFVLRTLRYWTQQYKVSILVIAHARRHRHNAPIGLRHLTGSRRLTYAFDSIFALNRTALSDDMVYVKHLKSRNSAIYTDSLHVHVMRLEKKGSGSPLTFNTVDNPHSTDERILLNVCDEETAEKAREKAAELKALGWSLREIAEYFSISHTAVRRLLNIPLKQQQDQQQEEHSVQEQQQELKHEQKHKQKKKSKKTIAVSFRKLRFVSPAQAGSPCCCFAAAPKSQRRRPHCYRRQPTLRPAARRRRPTGVA